MMRSLRARLAISYGLLTAVALSIAVLALARVVLDLSIRPMVQAVDQAAAQARGIVAAGQILPTQILLERIARDAIQPGVMILRPPGRERPGPGGPPDGGGFPGNGPGGIPGDGPGGPPRDGGPPGGFPGGFSGGGPPPRQRGPGELNMKSLLGLPERIVRVRESAVVVTLDPRRTDQVISTYLRSVGFALFLVLVAASFIGRWIASLAIAPLRVVTAELNRFASGDFSQRPVTARDRNELGELIDAYNGATAQVAAAFAERQRIEAHMQQFVSHAGHELRTPLTIVSGFLSILENGGYRNAEIRERAFKTLSRETARMRLLVEQLMALARLERPEPTAPSEVDLLELIRDVIGALATARKGVVVMGRADDASVYADPAEIYEAVSNLVDNGLKYGEGSEVRVDVARERGEVVVRVADGGPGLPEAIRSRIFERFFRGPHEKAIEGSGLGLAIVARAAERAGGSVVLERAEPGETVFALRLPLADRL